MLIHLVTALLLSWQTSPAAPRAAVDELIAADRAFAKASAQTGDVIAGIAPMLADDVVMPIPGSRFATTKAEVLSAMRTNPANLADRAEWIPIRGGVSADGQHGFTFGYMTTRKADGTESPGKYLAYWIRRREGWRVAVYRRRPRGAGEVSMEMMPSAVPSGAAPASADAARIEAARVSLERTERAFSDEAQTIGLGAAFTRFGHPDAVNMGPPDAAGFIVGAAAIGKSIGAGAPATSSPVSWSPDRVIVAASGDLGVTIGMIRANEGTSPPVPFFTIWIRQGANGQWRYIAE